MTHQTNSAKHHSFPKKPKVPSTFDRYFLQETVKRVSFCPLWEAITDENIDKTGSILRADLPEHGSAILELMLFVSNQ